ncbi:C-X-C chemokine receptor type 6-like [Pristis pectinata]|uniref:C-X-C chemokine receptor type 6-like n=1 Tax=Pristis pectinata TaxID=685728 RepID=UPI00223E6919|nr:C-X-C chemokine receptor type 6-like [Pristis pectinata]
MEHYDYGYYDYNESSTSVNDAETFCDNSKVTDFKGVYMPSLYAIIFVAGLLGNSLVIVIKVLYEKLKTITDLYMMNLAIADLILLCTLPLWAVDAQIGWTFGTFMCKVVNGVYTVNFYSCVFILTCVTINRYHAIVQATKMLQYKIIHGMFICGGVWVLAIILSLPEFILSDTNVDDPGKITCRMNYPPNSKIFKVGVCVTQMVVGFLIPFVTMIICYTIIAKKLLQAKGFQKHKSLKIIVAVVTVFMICELPFNIALLLQTLQIVSEESRSCEYYANINYAIIVTESIAYIHCCLNPILYVFIGVKFRNNFWKILKDVGCISQKQLHVYLKIECETSQQRSCVSETTVSPL